MEWISVNERLPEMREPYPGGPKRWYGLIFTGSYITAGRYEETYVKRQPSWKDSGGRCAFVTHWMEFPQPPKED